ncbi:sigma 54-interacting transcriptional regulator [Candidatus Accumulibacter phosphatis]|uniref:sigma 54-interacting transcriptional regulator n=1 Tax=Candidatus Accumulibacter phosphatis TaxID=327160 RepID=UPI0039B97FF1
MGETGTGKGQAAAAIGRSGHIPYLWHQRRFAANFAESFIAINLSQFPETLIESELFGHRKGAFTGAIEHHDGVLMRSSAYGTRPLDEIGEVSIPIQIKLLQVLQEGSFTPIGSHQT